MGLWPIKAHGGSYVYYNIKYINSVDHMHMYTHFAHDLFQLHLEIGTRQNISLSISLV